MDDGWIAFRNGSFEKEYWIHPARTVDWIRKRTPSGGWTYYGSARLVGEKGKARRVVVMIERKLYSRHRLIALAKDGTVEGLAKFRDGKNNPVMHGKRRREDERPDDTPENVRFGTHAENRNDQNNKKRKTYASSHPVILTDEEGRRKYFDSVKEAAKFLDVRQGNLSLYLNGDRPNPPKSPNGIWKAEYNEFELPGAVRLVRASAELYLSPGRPNELFRKLPTGKFAATEFESGEDGYIRPSVEGGGQEALHRLVVETLDPDAFVSKLDANPGLTKADLQVDHIDGDKRNNAIDNLKVLTATEHARKHAFAVDWVDDNGNVLDSFECAADAVKAVMGSDGHVINPACVRFVCDGECSQTSGRLFRWKYPEFVKSMRKK